MSPEELVAALSERGCSHAASISLRGVYYDYGQGNAETLEAASRLPFIIPVATIDPRRYFGGRRQPMELGGFRMIRLFPDRQGWPLEYAPLGRIMELSTDREMTVVIPASGPGNATKISSLVKARGLRLILTSINYSTLSEALVLLDENPGLYLSTDMLNTPDGIELVCDEAGPDRIVFGSGFPTTYFEGPRLAVERAEISQKSKDAIFRGNITGLVGLK